MLISRSVSLCLEFKNAFNYPSIHGELFLYLCVNPPFSDASFFRSSAVFVLVEPTYATHSVQRLVHRLLHVSRGATSCGGSRHSVRGRNLMCFSECLFLRWIVPKSIAKLDGGHGRIFPLGPPLILSLYSLHCSTCLVRAFALLVEDVNNTGVLTSICLSHFARCDISPAESLFALG